MEILKQKNTSVDIPKTRKLDGLQQALHTHTASRIHQPLPNNLHILKPSTQRAFCSRAQICTLLPLSCILVVFVPCWIHTSASFWWTSENFT